MGGVSSGTGLKWNKKFNKAKINSRTFLIFFMMDSRVEFIIHCT